MPITRIQQKLLDKRLILKVRSEREATEVARFGEVLRWSSDSEGETEKTTRADTEKRNSGKDGVAWIHRGGDSQYLERQLRTIVQASV
jgi:hypothetical protein